MSDLTIRELAEITGRHPETLRRLARLDRLPGAYKLGRTWSITREAADRLRHVPESVQAAGDNQGRSKRSVTDREQSHV